MWECSWRPALLWTNCLTWVLGTVLDSAMFEHPSCGRLWWRFCFKNRLFALHWVSTAVNISSSEMIGAKLVLLVCNGTPGRMGGTETCFYYVSVNFDRTYCFFWQKFCCWSSSELRIENLIKSYHCPWKWLFQNEVRGRRWDKACFVCSAGKHQRLGRKFDARTVSF